MEHLYGGLSDTSSSSLPVFLFPNLIQFAHSVPQERKILTLYNPYEFPIVYKVLSTASRKYTVLEPSGVIHAKRAVDISIRHLTAGTDRSLIGLVDYFKVEIHRERDPSNKGSKVIQVHLLEYPENNKESLERTSFHNIPRTRVNSRFSQETMPQRQFAPDDNISNGNFLVLVFLALACSTLLMFPTHHEPAATDSIIPPILHPSVSQKIFFAFLLGIIVAVLLMRPRIN
ncbi:hypothetical protein L596_015046 [Steinernema carpocapsae]|uniref:MSP domain-containing protein n=1 Tax=Steinernema carpocapsae TaxID=34508 RepID=A0A4U5NEN5_STECR|nr:hypothetical protein L596_015046 [Steinernema carpocapsae]